MPRRQERFDFEMSSAMEIDGGLSAGKSSSGAERRLGVPQQTWPLCCYSTPLPFNLPADFLRPSTSAELAEIGLTRREDSPCFFGDTPSPGTNPPNSASPANAMQLD